MSGKYKVSGTYKRASLCRNLAAGCRVKNKPQSMSKYVFLYT